MGQGGHDFTLAQVATERDHPVPGSRYQRLTWIVLVTSFERSPSTRSSNQTAKNGGVLEGRVGWDYRIQRS